MIDLLQPLLGSPWLGLAAGAAAGAGLALWLGHGRRRDRRRRAELAAALGGAADTNDAAGAAPQAGLLARVEELRAAALRSHQIQLRLAATELRLAVTDSVLANLQDGILVVDGSEQVLFANDVARTVLQFGQAKDATLASATAGNEIVGGMRTVLAADLARGVKSCRVEVGSGDERVVYVIRSIGQAAIPGADQAQVIALEDRTAEERTARAKSEFIYSISHELKTPLTAIQASLELANEPAGLSTEDRDKLIRISYEESVRLSQMVAELLDLARIEAGLTEFKRDTVNVRDLLTGLQAMHGPLAERKGIAMQWTISDYLGDLVGDARLLRQAMVNIVGNALKYTKNGGEVALTARLEGQELVLRVRDTGIGIATEDQGRVFEKFFRAKSAEQSTITGTGLGLPMARYIVERHRGRIEMTSELGVGTEFRVYLPASTTDAEGEGAPTLVAVDGAAE